MALEAINNAMGVQATGYVAPQKVQSSSEKVEISNENKVEPSSKIENSTPIVEKTENKDNSDYKGEQQNGQSAASNEQLKQALEKITKKMGNSEAVYGIHEGTNRVTIKLVDKDTKETIKELPPEKTLDMIARVWEMAGILVDEKR